MICRKNSIYVHDSATSSGEKCGIIYIVKYEIIDLISPLSLFSEIKAKGPPSRYGGLFASQQITEQGVGKAVNGDGGQLEQQQEGKPPPGHVA